MGGYPRTIGEVHGYGTRSARGGLYVGTRDHRSVGYRVPAEWGSLTDAQRGMGSLAGFKRGSREGFLAGYRRMCVCGLLVMCARVGVVRDGAMVQRGQGSGGGVVVISVYLLRILYGLNRNPP